MSRNKKFNPEYFIINLFVFAFIGVLSFSFLHFDVFDPFKHSFKDFSLYDIYYSQITNKQTLPDKDIVVVNFGYSGRKEIAGLIDKIAHGEPKAIGIDAVFSRWDDSSEDSLLAATVARNRDILVGGFNSRSNRLNALQIPFVHQGDLEVGGNDPYTSTIRHLSPVMHGKPGFALKVLELGDSALAAEYINGKHDEVFINYFGNVNTDSQQVSKFEYADYRDVISNNFDPDRFRKKFVLIGFMGSTVSGKELINTDSVTFLVEDKFFTPLNERVSGRSFPDMYGVVIHANILHMLLNRECVNETHAAWSWLVAFLLCLSITPIFVHFFVKKHMWFHILAKFSQLIASVVVVYFSFVFLDQFLLKIDLMPIVTSVALYTDLIYFYDAVVKILNKWFGSIFSRSAFLHHDTH